MNDPPRERLRIAVISDWHLGDRRGRPQLTAGQLAERVDDYDVDLLINLNDTVSSTRHLDTPPDKTPEEAYLDRWLHYGEAFRSRLNCPAIDVAIARDLDIWDRVATNPPHGIVSMGQVHILWLAPEYKVRHLSGQQLVWALKQIRQYPDDSWLVACHSPVEGAAARTGNVWLKGSDHLKTALHSYARRAVIVGGHFHYPPDVAPRREGNKVLTLAGFINSLGGDPNSYAKIVTFEPARIRIENANLTAGCVDNVWTFEL